ncbi:MAG: CpsB/CapC family capsule biosynthesis tyrosine phosphatase [Faecalimonas sp.]|nr:CpsB/CapC family capsule biosynthesis tyrosine phosphatase [Faecalimonas sp.]
MSFDVHCHILPKVDDGAKDEGSTKRMLEIADAEGIDVIVATPHFQCGERQMPVEELKNRFASVRSWWEEYGEEKKLYLGNELFYSESLVDALEHGEALTMNGTSYVLVEFPIYVDYMYILKGIQRLRYAGYIPIVAHIERYDCLQNRKRVQELVQAGAYMQVNTSTIMGGHGYFAHRYVMNLFKYRLLHFVGTDAHDSKGRKPEMEKCAAYLEKKIGPTKAHRILVENPEKMLRGEELYG